MFQPKLTKIADYGTGEPWVARTEMTMLEFLPFIRTERHVDLGTSKNVAADFDKKKEILTGKVMALAEELGQAFLALRQIRTVDDEFPTQLESVKAYRDLYSHLWIAYKDRFQKLMKDLGYDIGFVFQNDSGFEEKAINFLKTHPDVDPELMDRLREDKAGWHLALRTFRDDGEHNSSEPTFDGHPMHSLRTAEVIFSNVWHAIEDVFICCMQDDFGRQLTIFEIPEGGRDPVIPKKYKVGLILDEKTGEVKVRAD
jgi:hypothetical protein